MAKRGETRPWRMAFKWENGVKGMNAYRTEWDAQFKADELREYAERIGARIEIILSHREDKI